MDLTKYEDFLNEKKATRTLKKGEKEKLISNIKEGEVYLGDLEEALVVMNSVGVLVQQKFERVVEELVTQALQFVFGDVYSFEVESKIVRNQPEIFMYINVDGEGYSPRDEETSGGETDVASFALRVILWAIQYDKTEPTLILDEPFRNLSRNHINQVNEMLQYLSRMLGLQIIIISHIYELAETADTVFYVRKVEGVSVVEKKEIKRS